MRSVPRKENVSKASPQLSFATHLLDGDIGITLHGLIQLVPQAFVAAEREKRKIIFWKFHFRSQAIGKHRHDRRQTTKSQPK
jgi:hypothetical protein